jgi:hypothetical protein
MVFSDRDNFIVASVIMITSDSLKKMPRTTRSTVLQFIRDSKYKSITDEDWHEIAEGINAHKKQIFDLLLNAFHESSSNPSVSADKAFVELDNSIKEELGDIDFDELKKKVDESNDPKLREYFLTMKQLKRDFDDERE